MPIDTLKISLCRLGKCGDVNCQQHTTCQRWLLRERPSKARFRSMRRLKPNKPCPYYVAIGEPVQDNKSREFV